MASAETQKRVLMAVGAIVLIAIVIIAILFSRSPEKNVVKAVNVTIWGPLDEEGGFNRAIQDLFPPNYSIRYIKKDPTTYDEDLLRAFAMGPNQPNAPDIFYIKNSALSRYLPYLQPTNDPALYTAFKNKFVDVAIADFTDGTAIYGAPLFVDSLALFWNKELFNSTGIELPPKTWAAVQEDVEKLTKKDEALNIQRSGISLGGAKNINHATDILYALMMQNNVPMNKGQGKLRSTAQIILNATEPINFFFDFSDPKKAVYTWNKQMNYSTDLFAEGKLAMTLGYSYELQKIRSKNPYLNFEVSEFPQLKEDADKKVTYADYWGLVVWNRSLHKDDAWAALTQFMREDVQRKYTTVFRRPTALRHYIPEQKNDPEIGVFAGQSLYAKSWYIADDVVVNEYFNEMIEAVLNKETQLQPALQRLEDKINLLVKQRAQVE